MTPLTIIGARLDTVEVSYSGTIDPEIIELLNRRKEIAQQAEVGQPITLGLLEFLVMDRAFGFWKWRLVNPLFSIVACPTAGVSGIVAQVRISSFGLANEYAESLTLQIRCALECLGELTEVSVSRADVCADVQGFRPTPELMRNMVCPASLRAQIGTESEVETYQFGKGDVLRAYNKTRELLHSKKEWLRAVWEHHPDYQADQDVWRIEFQARRQRLKELGITSLAILFVDAGALLDAGMRWAQLRVPDGENKSRWAEDKRWTQIRTAAFDGVPLQRQVKPSSLMSLDRARSQYIGAIATAAAYNGDTDFMKANIKLCYSVEAHMMAEGIDFAELAEQKRRRILTGC